MMVASAQPPTGKERSYSELCPWFKFQSAATWASTSSQEL
jgi:hypothetical protein